MLKLNAATKTWTLFEKHTIYIENKNKQNNYNEIQIDGSTAHKNGHGSR